MDDFPVLTLADNRKYKNKRMTPTETEKMHRDADSAYAKSPEAKINKQKAEELEK